MNQTARLRYRRTASPANTNAHASTQLGRQHVLTRVPVRETSLRNWWLSGISLGLAGLAELILAGRMAVQTLDVQGGLARLVFDLGGFLQSPFVDISKEPAFTHGVFEPDTIRAIIAYGVLGLVLPVIAFLGAVPITSFNFTRGTLRLMTAAGIALRDLGTDIGRGGRWAWTQAPVLTRNARPALENAGTRAVAACQRLGPAMDRAHARTVRALQQLGPALERGRDRTRTTAQQFRPVAEQALAQTREHVQQLRPVAQRAQLWAQQASRELQVFQKELQTLAVSLGRHYRRWADDLAARRH